MMLASIGVVTMRSDGERITQAALLLLDVVFTFVGSLLVFGRGITAIDLGQHVIVKTRTGLTTFGEGLADDEIQYLHAIVRRTLAG